MMKIASILSDPAVIARIVVREHFDCTSGPGVVFNICDCDWPKLKPGPFVFRVITELNGTWDLCINNMDSRICCMELDSLSPRNFGYLLLRSDTAVSLLPIPYPFAKQPNPRLRRADIKVGDLVYYVSPKGILSKLVVAEAVVVDKGPDGDPKIKVNKIVFMGSSGQLLIPESEGIIEPSPANLFPMLVK